MTVDEIEVDTTAPARGDIVGVCAGKYKVGGGELPPFYARRVEFGEFAVIQISDAGGPGAMFFSSSGPMSAGFWSASETSSSMTAMPVPPRA